MLSVCKQSFVVYTQQMKADLQDNKQCIRVEGMHEAIDSHPSSHACRQTDIGLQADNQKVIQADNQTVKQTDSQAKRETESTGKTYRNILKQPGRLSKG